MREFAGEGNGLDYGDEGEEVELASQQMNLVDDYHMQEFQENRGPQEF